MFDFSIVSNDKNTESIEMLLFLENSGIVDKDKAIDIYSSWENDIFEKSKVDVAELMVVMQAYEQKLITRDRIKKIGEYLIEISEDNLDVMSYILDMIVFMYNKDVLSREDLQPVIDLIIGNIEIYSEDPNEDEVEDDE